MEKRTYQEYQKQPQNQSQDQEMKEVQKAQTQPEGQETQGVQEQPMPKTELWAEGFQNLRNIRYDMGLRILLVVGVLSQYYVSFRRPRIDIDGHWGLLLVLAMYLLLRFSPANREVFKNKYTGRILAMLFVVPTILVWIFC